LENRSLARACALVALLTLACVGAHAQQSAFDAGNGLTAPARVAIINTTHWIDMLNSRIGSGMGENTGVWLRGRHVRGDLEGGSDNSSGFDFDGAGIALGADTALGANSRLGIAYSHLRGNTTLAGGAGTAITRTPQLAAYGTHVAGPWQFKGMLGVGRHDIESNRALARSDHRANEWSGYAEANYTFKQRGYETRTVMGLRYISLDEDRYTEEGGAAPLTVDERKTESITPLVGLRWLWPFNAERGRVELRGIYSYEAGDAGAAMSGSVAGAAVTFATNGAPISRHAVTVGIGIENEVARRLSLHGDYSLDLRSGSMVHALVLGVRYAF
jgi:outer membrane autotransporter protein